MPRGKGREWGVPFVAERSDRFCSDTPPSDPASVERRLDATAHRHTDGNGRGVRLASCRPSPRPKQSGGLIRPRQTAVLSQRVFLGRGHGRVWPGSFQSTLHRRGVGRRRESGCVVGGSFRSTLHRRGVGWRREAAEDPRNKNGCRTPRIPCHDAFILPTCARQSPNPASSHRFSRSMPNRTRYVWARSIEHPRSGVSVLAVKRLPR
jgi:hypothetical protein